ncbi:MAG: hypothetical protein IKU51_00925 [Clostridia bacterium]|nr:hypothetical protein [Clostridia bacterium]
MPLYFTKPRRWPPSRPVQFVLAFLALLLTLAVLAVWLFIGYRNNKSPEQPDEGASSAVSEPLAGVGNLLLIINEADHEQFVLIQAAPDAGRMTAVPLPANLDVGDGVTLCDTLRKHGSPRAKQAVATLLELPIKQYITLTAKDAESYFGYLDEGITLTLSEEITYTDKNGATIHLSAGEKTLAAGQAAALLQYTGWKEPENGLNLAADLTVALLNRYLTPLRAMEGHFAALSNAAQTDLRIDDFNAYRSTLAHLAAKNDGNLCRRVVLDGSTVDGLFVPDMVSFRAQSGLYD